MYRHPLRLVIVGLLISGIASAENWPEWRGSTSNGLANGNPPITWSETKNIKWKVPVPGSASSTPVVWGDKIFVTTSVLVGELAPKPTGRRKRGEAESKPTNPYKFNLVCLDRNTGEILWERTAAEAIPHEGHHPTSTFAPHSAITDGNRVWVSFGSRGLHCYDLDGNHQWTKDLFPMTMSNTFGEGISASLAGDAIIVLMDHEGESKLMSFDKMSGDLLWEKVRDEISTWATPLVAEIDGKLQIIANGETHIRGYDAETGEVLWKSAGLDDATIPMPIIGHGNIYVASGYRRPKMRAIKLGGSGDLGEDALLWQVDKYTPYVGSPLLMDDRIYVTRGLSGSLSCFNALTGEAIYEREPLEGIRTVYTSPVGVAGRIYVAGRKGTTVVVEHSDTFKILATNVLYEGCDGSPVVIGDELYLRGTKHLYCIAEQ
ncbi:MAG: PQQ-binding-like beta-propeller repeat protein [Candidatus Hydrogenedentota bacterium]